MASNYWIKLYIEILNDSKMARLSDRLYRRTIELFLLAGEHNDNGNLPSPGDIAWRLRVDEEQLETEMIELQRMGILSINDGRWWVTKFAERQAAVPDAERMRQYRERRQKQQYYGDVTDSVTIRNVESDTESDTDTDTEQKQNGGGSQYRQMVTAFCNATSISELHINPKKLADAVDLWLSMGVTPAELGAVIGGMLENELSIAGPQSVSAGAINVHRSRRGGKRQKATTATPADYARWDTSDMEGE